VARVATTSSLTSDSELDLAFQVIDMYQKAKQALGRRHELWRKSYRLVHNRMWSPTRDPSMPSPSASEIYPILASLVGWETDQQTRFEPVPSVDPHSPNAEFMQGLAKDLEKCLESIWANYDIDAEIEKTLWDSMIYGTGFWKVVWDPGLDDGAGNAINHRVDPFSIFTDPDAKNETDANYIIEARLMSLQEIERRWPGKIEAVSESLDRGHDLPGRDDPFADGPARVPMSNTGGIQSSQGTGKPVYGLPGQSRKVIDFNDDRGVVVYECWVKENVAVEVPDPDEVDATITVFSPQWRVVVVAADQVLMDERATDLWNHGRHPYVRVVQHDLGDFWGVALVEHLAPAQLAINRLLAALQHHAELCGNPILMEDARSGIARTKIVNEPGQRVTKNTGSEVGWMVPPDMPNGVQALVTFWVNEMERISGLSAMVRGATPTGRNAQGVLDSVQESAFVRVRLALRNLERSLSKAGGLLANLVVENYTLPRTVAIAGPDGERSMLALKGRHFYAPTFAGADPMKFALYVRAGASMPISRSARAQEADTLFAMGAIDHQAVLEAHDYPTRRQILERVNAMMGIGIEPGGQGRNRQR